MELFKKLSQAFRFFSVDSKNVITKNARVFDRADADNAWHVLANGHATIQFVEMPKKCKAGNAVQPEN
jgi:hypothetical protein